MFGNVTALEGWGGGGSHLGDAEHDREEDAHHLSDVARDQVTGSGLWYEGLAFRAWGLEFGASGFEFRVQGSGFGVQGLCLWFRDWRVELGV